LERKLKLLANVPDLVVDDFAVKLLCSPQDEDFHDLIAIRYETAATILTSNLDVSEVGEAISGNRILGAAKLDRLRHGTYRIVINGERFRTPNPCPNRLERGLQNRLKKRVLAPVRNRVCTALPLAPLRRSVTTDEQFQSEFHRKGAAASHKPACTAVPKSLPQRRRRRPASRNS